MDSQLIVEPSHSNPYGKYLIFDIFSKLNLSPKFGVCNNMTNHGKAVCKNEYGCQLLAQPGGSNVNETSLIDLSGNSLGIFSKLKLTTKSGVCNNLTNQGKAVFKNEYGCQLLAQPDGLNVQETRLVSPMNLGNLA